SVVTCRIGSKPRWKKMTAHRYSDAKTQETSTMRISAAIGPDAALNDGSPRMITADAAPASAEASTYFQTASTIEATPRPAGLPAYRSAGTVKTQKYATHAAPTPSGSNLR